MRYKSYSELPKNTTLRIKSKYDIVRFFKGKIYEGYTDHKYIYFYKTERDGDVTRWQHDRESFFHNFEIEDAEVSLDY